MLYAMRVNRKMARTKFCERMSKRCIGKTMLTVKPKSFAQGNTVLNFSKLCKVAVNGKIANVTIESVETNRNLAKLPSTARTQSVARGMRLTHTVAQNPLKGEEIVQTLLKNKDFLHIGYVELSGDPNKNLDAYEAIVRYAHDKEMTYFSINTQNDRCPVCGYLGIIGDECPRCGFKEGEGVTVEHLKACGCWDNIKKMNNL